MADHVIDGARIDGIPSLYDELNRVFMSAEGWRLGESLDALDDLLYGGIGALRGDPTPRVRWRHAEHSRASLGAAETERWLRAKLARPGVYATERIRAQLDELRAGTGRTYFDLVLDVFADHPSIALELA